MEILFVDDDSEEAHAFKEAIITLADGIRVSHITFSTEVLWLLKSKKHDMVFLRVTGETKNAFYFLQAIRSLKELGALPVIMYSTDWDDSQVDRFYKAKATYYLQKQEKVSDTLKAFSTFITSEMKSQKRISKSAFVV